MSFRNYVSDKELAHKIWKKLTNLTSRSDLKIKSVVSMQIKR